jgi:hypothetical protein
MFPRQSVKHVLGLIRQESGGTRHGLPAGVVRRPSASYRSSCARTIQDRATSGIRLQAHGRTMRDVLGQLGGVPSWLQHDETPTCPSCREGSFLWQC